MRRRLGGFAVLLTALGALGLLAGCGDPSGPVAPGTYQTRLTAEQLDVLEQQCQDELSPTCQGSMNFDIPRPCIPTDPCLEVTVPADRADVAVVVVTAPEGDVEVCERAPTLCAGFELSAEQLVPVLRSASPTDAASTGSTGGSTTDPGPSEPVVDPSSSP